MGFLLILWAPSQGWSKPVIVVDAAHGGNDSGVKVGSELEKDWNLKFALAIGKALESLGFEVILVRQKDETLSQDKRAQIINTSQASAVLVIHADCDWTGNRRGPLIVVEPPTQGNEATEIPRWGIITPYQYRNSLKLGRDIAQALGLNAELSSLSDSRGLAGEAVSPTSNLFCLPHQSLRYLTPPSAVITPLFLSSSQDIKKFSQDSAISEFAARVARGVEFFWQ